MQSALVMTYITRMLTFPLPCCFALEMVLFRQDVVQTSWEDSGYEKLLTLYALTVNVD